MSGLQGKVRRSPGAETGDSAVVGELHREVVVLLAHQLLDGLQVVALLRRHPELVALDLRLDALGALVADQFGDLPGVVRADPLLEGDRDLAHPSGLARLGRVEHLEADVALDQLLLEHVENGVRPVVGRGADLYGVLALPVDGGAGALEVEPGGDLACRLSQGVVDLLAVDLAHDVERRVSHALSSPYGAACDSGLRFALRYCFAPLSTGQAGSDDIPGRLPERPMGADCKSVGVCLRRFESCTCHTTRK